MLFRVDCRRDPNWLALALESVRSLGYALVEKVLSPALLQELRLAMYDVRSAIHADVGSERLARAGELGVLRLMLQHHPIFFRLLEVPEMLAIVDATVSPTAILHLQNGFILPSFPIGDAPRVFQNRFHMDFPRVLNGYLASINCFFAIDAFSRQNGGTVLAPGTHQRPSPPDPAFLTANSTAVECDVGSMLVFDSTLYHASGPNTSGADRLAINHQFTRSYIKQQIDYVRALGSATILAQKPRTQQLLGWYTRVVTSLDEYYRPEDERLYRSGQG